ncbi:DUF2330 domain-containing protein [Mycolicibacterium canariasense]|nr:DUF2330 domain-containing protein [Mycolicibacterium canariasense]ORU98026.1 hypothetical protein AWB94_29095 [Mycolicibacterium canariasense]
MPMRVAHRSFCAVLMLLAALVAHTAAPAWACGCGAYIPDRAGAAVVDERALVTWDGLREDILMSLGVTGSSDRAAWVMPVPSAAQVSLGDIAVFGELTRLTAPRVEYRDSWWPTFDWLQQGSSEAFDTAGAAPGAGVQVLSSQRIGPFDVTRLRGDDPAALAGWLADKGFPHPDGLDANLAPYVADGWEIVAIQLVPGAAGASLTGTLQPLRLSFAADKADEVVYPMRLSRSATAPQTVDLYLLAAHRMDPVRVPVPGNAPTLQFAGPVHSAVLAPYLDGVRYLTRWTNHLNAPQDIDGDYLFARAETDTDYQQVILRTRNHGDITGAVLLGGLLVGAAAAVIVTLRRRRQAR